MSVLSLLAREHRLLERLMGRLEAALAPEAEVDGKRLSRLLAPLDAALLAHEELERRVYAAANGGPASRAMERQHRELAEVRLELEEELARPAPGERLRGLARLYFQGLRYHFLTEEARL